MKAAVNETGEFICRPEIESTYLSPAGEEKIIAATWENGVVFKDGPVCSASKFVENYTFIKKELCDA